MADDEEFPLHKCVFSGDLRKLSALIRIHDVSTRDKHGNVNIISIKHHLCVISSMELP